MVPEGPEGNELDRVLGESYNMFGLCVTPMKHRLDQRCAVCQLGLKGEKEAVEHATKTGHSNFAEY